MSTTEERDEAFASAHRAIATQRLATAVIRDTFLTPSEQATRMNAYIECLDATPIPTEEDDRD